MTFLNMKMTTELLISKYSGRFVEAFENKPVKCHLTAWLRALPLLLFNYFYWIAPVSQLKNPWIYFLST